MKKSCWFYLQICPESSHFSPRPLLLPESKPSSFLTQIIPKSLLASLPTSTLALLLGFQNNIQNGPFYSVTFCLNFLKGLPFNSELSQRLSQRSTKTYSASTQPPVASVTFGSLCLLHIRTMHASTPGTLHRLFPLPGMLFSLTWLPCSFTSSNSLLKCYLCEVNTILFKMAILIPEFHIILILIFSPIALIAIDVLRNFLSFSFITSLSLAISTLWKFSAYSFGLSCHVYSKPGNYLEREVGCVLAVGLFPICRLPPWGRKCLSLLFLDVFSSTQNSPCM